MKNETLITAIVAVLGTVGILGISYLFTTGLLALILWLSNQVLETAFNPNIWMAGLLLWLVLLVLKSVFSVTINK